MIIKKSHKKGHIMSKGKKSDVIAVATAERGIEASNPIITMGVRFTVQKYGEALRRLADE